MTAPDGMRHGRVKDAASYEIFTHSPLCVSKRSPVRRGGTHRCRPTNMDGLPHMVCGAGTSSGTVRHKAAVLHPLWGGDGGLRAYALGIAPVATGAWGRWGVSLAAASGSFARCGGRVFRALRGATGALPLDPAILGCPPPVGKSGRRGIFRQSKVWVRSHTGCMARNHTAAMAEKARRAPQTHGWRAAPSEKKSSKTFIFVLLRPFRDGNCCFTTLSIFRSCRRRTCWLRREPAPARRPWTGWPDGTAWSDS